MEALAALRQVLPPAVMLLLGLALPAEASMLDPELRIATSWRGASDVNVFSAAWYGSAPGWTKADRFEFSLGAFSDDDHSRPFVFAGPVWRLTDPERDAFVEFSFGPTGIAGSVIGGRELGGNWQFRSALALGRQFARRRPLAVSLRLAHVSNGGFRKPNPGLDSIGLGLFKSLGER